MTASGRAPFVPSTSSAYRSPSNPATTPTATQAQRKHFPTDRDPACGSCPFPRRFDRQPFSSPHSHTPNRPSTPLVNLPWRPENPPWCPLPPVPGERWWSLGTPPSLPGPATPRGGEHVETRGQQKRADETQDRPIDRRSSHNTTRHAIIDNPPARWPCILETSRDVTL